MQSSTSKMAARYRELLEGLEQRTHERVNLALECRVSSPSKRSAGTMKIVENISRTGILIRWLASDSPEDVTRAYSVSFFERDSSGGDVNSLAVRSLSAVLVEAYS